MSWDAFAESVTEAQKLAQPEDFDFLHRIGESYATLRRYAPEFLAVLKLRAAPPPRRARRHRGAARHEQRQRPQGARRCADRFIKPRWQKLVMTDTGIDRRYYELCALSELKNALRSGDIWVQGSRQFKDFEDYLVPPAKFASLKQASELPLAVATDCDQYLNDRLTLLETQLATVNRMATANELPDAIITESGLKITPLGGGARHRAGADRPDGDDPAARQDHRTAAGGGRMDGLHPALRAPEIGRPGQRQEPVADHDPRRRDQPGPDQDGRVLPRHDLRQAGWLQAWHIRDETYSAALAELVNAQFRHPFAEHWGDGTTSSSDGQNFRTGSKAESTGHINPKYGSSPGGRSTPISPPVRAVHTKVVNVGVRDSTYVLDGLLYHESDLRIEEHYTDTAGFTDHVFALMHLLGFRFAPRIRDLGDTKLYIPKGDAAYDALKPMIGGTLNIKHVRAHWDEILRLATSIKQGTVTASLMLRKLGSYPRQNGLAVALRELGRIERTLFILDWLQSVELRRRVHAGLNKGEARNALARAVFFNRLGEIRDRSFEQQRYRASGLNLVTAAIVLWNTVYLERAAQRGATAMPLMTRCCSTCRRWVGSTSTSPAITSGAAAPRSARGSSGRYDRCNRLSVLLFNEMVTPSFPVLC
jgi:TnpA family transposase